MTEQTFDAIVVGSGISGGWAAKELTEHGLKVLLLERGENIEHITGYVNALKAPWEIPHRDRITNQIREVHATMTRDSFMNEANANYWTNEKESPYVEKRPFDWFRGYHVGGRSLMWGRQSYRWNRFDYEANLKEGVGVDWPIRYEDMAPWYDHVESFAGISGSLEGLEQLPDGKFLPPMELNVVEKAVAARIRAHYADSRRLIIGRVANLTEPHNGRADCQYRNKCDLGCPFGAYFSTQSSTLPAAATTGNLTLRPFSIVTRLLYDRDRQEIHRASRSSTRETRRHAEFESRIVFLCASTLNSAWVLMNSATDVWPDGLGQQQRRARPQRHGPPFPRRGVRRRRGIRGQVLLRAPGERLLHTPVQEPLRRQAQLHARLRLPGQRRPQRMGAGDRRARDRRRDEGRPDRAGPLAHRDDGLRRDRCRTTTTGSSSTGTPGTSGACRSSRWTATSGTTRGRCGST